MRPPAGYETISPELRLSITSIVRDMYEEIIRDTIDEKIKGVLKSVDSDMRDTIRKSIKDKLNTFSEESLDESLKGFLTKYNEKTESRLNTTEQKVAHIFTQSMPPYYVNKFNELFNKVVQFEAIVRVVDATMKNFVSEKFVEIVTNDELKQLYVKANVTMKDIEDWFKVSPSQAHRISNGEIQDPIIRHKLKQKLLVKIQERVLANA